MSTMLPLQQKLRTLLVLLGLFLPLLQYGQTSGTSQVIDSLNALLKTCKDDHIRCDLWNQLASAYQRSDIDKAESYNKQGLALAKKLGDQKRISSAYFMQGAIDRLHGDYEKSLGNMQEACRIRMELKDTVGYADCLYAIGVVCNLLNDQKKAMLSLTEAMSIYEKKHLTKNQSRTYNALGVIYLSQKEFGLALENFEKSLKIDQASGSKLGASASLLNMGNVYYQGEKDFRKAITYFEEALKLKRELKDAQGIQKCLNNIGAAYMSLGEIDKSIVYHQQALQSALEINNKGAVATCYINLGYDYEKGKKYAEAIRYSKIGYELAKTLENDDLMTEATRVLHESYAAQNNFAEAYKYLLTNKVHSDTLESKRNVSAVNEIKSKFDVVKKDNEIKALNISHKEQELQLERFKARNYLFIVLIFCGVIALGFYYYRSRNSRRLNAKLQEINNLKSHFFANLSHEFRTPITLMLGPVEKLLDNARKEDEAWLRLIHRNANRLLFLDEQLLEFTRIDSGNQSIHLSFGNIVLPTKAISASYELVAIRNDIQYSMHFGEERIDTWFDNDILEKVISNLLTNAFKYTHAGGSVEFRMALVSAEGIRNEVQHQKPGAGKFVRIDVADTGAGIPIDKREKIFERFYQLNNNPGSTFEGAGIGLALTRELLRLHHGWISLESEVGKGSVFSVFLPCEKEAYSAEEIRQAKTLAKYEPYVSKENPAKEGQTVQPGLPGLDPADSGDEKLPHILIVDDNSDMRLYIHEILKPWFRVTEASNGREGFTKATEVIPDLVITDVMMHEMDGMELCRLLKSDSRTNPVPVIMLTALTEQEEKIHGFGQGADDYMTKPFNSQELLVRAKNLISQREKLKSLFTNEFKMEASAVNLPSADATFLRNLISVIEKNIDNPELDVNLILEDIQISRTQLHRKLTSLTNQSVTGFIKVIRMKRAAQLIEQRSGNVTEVMYAVGFDNLSYFSKCFREVYAMTPREYMMKVDPSLQNEAGETSNS